MRKLKYGTLDVCKKKKLQNRDYQSFKCVACKKMIEVNERYRYKIGRELHEHCLQEYMDSDGYVTFDDNERPIKI